MTPKWELADNAYMRAEDVRRLFDALELAARRDRERGRTTWPRRFAMFSLLRFAGLRVSEVADLRVDDLDLHAERARVIIRQGKYRKRPAKGKRNPPKPEPAPLAVEAVPVLKAYLHDKENWGEDTAPNAWLFPSRGGHIQKRAIQHGFKQALDLAGLPADYSPHSLRHSYGVYLYRKTKDLRLVQKALRHRRNSTTEVYTDVLAEDMAAGVNGLYGEPTTEPVKVKTTPADVADTAGLLASWSDLTAEQKTELLPQFMAQLDTLTPAQRKDVARLFAAELQRRTPPRPTAPKKDRRTNGDRRKKTKTVKTDRRRAERRTVRYEHDADGRPVKVASDHDRDIEAQREELRQKDRERYQKRKKQLAELAEKAKDDTEE
jgi:site-specific recombinase XerD